MSTVVDESRAAGGRRAALPGVLWAAAWVSFFADVSTELIYGVLPAFYLGTLALGVVWLGFIEGLAETIVAMTQLFSGYVSDRTGKRKIWMLSGYGLSTAAKPFLALVTSGFGVTLLRGADRLGKGIRGAPRDALLAAALPESDRGRGFGVLRGMDHGGALLGGLIAAGLLAAGLAGPRDLFLWSVLPGAIAVLIIAVFIHEPARVKSESGARAREPFSPVFAWRRANVHLKQYLVAAAMMGLAESSDMLLLALCYQRFVDAGWSQQHALGMLPMLWAVLHVVRSLGSTWGGTLSDRVGRWPLLIGAWLFYALIYTGVALMAWGAHPGWSWVIFACYGLFAALSEGPEKALVADLEPDPDRRGTAYGLRSFVKGITALPAALLVGVLWHSNGAAVAFAFDAVIALIATGMLWWVGREVRRRSRHGR